MVEAGNNPSEREIRRNDLFIFVGPEGSGKTEQGKLLAQALNKPYISTGDIIREYSKDTSSAIGAFCWEILTHGTYLDAEPLLMLLGARLSQKDTKDGAVIDGALRSLEEVEGFETMLHNAGINNDVTIISLKSAGWEGVDRVLKRGRPGDTVDGTLSRLGKYYSDLAPRTSLVKKKWRFVQFPSHGLVDIHNEELKREKITQTHQAIMAIIKP